MRIDGAETILKALLDEIVAKLEKAEHIARAAQACAAAGDIPEAIQVSMDLDQPVLRCRSLARCRHAAYSE